MNRTSPGPPLDRLLDATVLLGFSRVGVALRHLEPVTTSMEGRRVVITGATGGIGRAAAVELGRLGAEVILVGRSEHKLSEAAKDVVAAGGAAQTELADLSLMRQVGELADRLVHRFPHIDVLINNVGILHPTRTETAEGIEATLATNLLGQFILTNRLAPALAASPDTSTVITVSSGGMYTAKLSADDLQSADSYRGSAVYARTKRAQVVLTEMWAEQLGPEGVVAHSMHPGWAATPGVTGSLPTFARVMAPILRTPEQGADTIVWLAADPRPALLTGLFWHDRVPRRTHRLGSTTEPEGERRRLWDALEDLATSLGVTSPDRNTR
jgi:dehydrogenase/reductase SDR family protein 12